MNDRQKKLVQQEIRLSKKLAAFRYKTCTSSVAPDTSPIRYLASCAPEESLRKPNFWFKQSSAVESQNRLILSSFADQNLRLGCEQNCTGKTAELWGCNANVLLKGTFRMCSTLRAIPCCYRHPGLVMLHNSFEDEHNFYQVLESCEGGNLYNVLQSADAPFSEEDVCIQVLSLNLECCHTP